MLQLLRSWRLGFIEEAEQEQPHGTDEVVEPESLTSEDVHGGEEASQSVEDSPNPAAGGEQPREDGEAGEAGEPTDGAPESAAGGGKQMACPPSASDGQDGDELFIAEFESGDEQPREDSGEPGGKPSSAPSTAQPSGNDDAGEGTFVPEFEIDEEEEEEADEGDAAQPQGQELPQEPGERNYREAFSLDLEELRVRRLASAFARIVGKVAEDAAGLPVEGDDEWDVEAIMRRRLDHRPLWQCRQSREKERVVILLDTSGSCYRQADLFRRIANLARGLGDAEVHAAPNGVVGGGWWSGPATETWPFERRVILFFGDFDGGDAVVEAARRNKVYWFSCEDRYEDMDEHDWCHYRLADLRGHYYECREDDDIIRLARKVRARQTRQGELYGDTYRTGLVPRLRGTR